MRDSELPAFSFQYRSDKPARLRQLPFRQRVCAPAGDIFTYDADYDAAAARACWECRRVVQTPWPFKVVAVAFAPKYLSFFFGVLVVL